jgi:hypothetical protein
MPILSIDAGFTLPHHRGYFSDSTVWQQLRVSYDCCNADFHWFENLNASFFSWPTDRANTRLRLRATLPLIGQWATAIGTLSDGG